MANKIKLIQINLHHAKAASALLCRRFIKNNFKIALIQEPWINQNTIRGLGSTGKLVYNSNGTRPRACILLSRDLNFISVPEFCTDDQAVACVTIHLGGSSHNIWVCSAYLPGDERQCSKGFIDLIDHCRKKNLQLVVGCDANAHHEIWNSSDTNSRGEYLVELINCYDLNILNIGNKATFRNSVREEIL